jgi:hypothetical protein
VLANHFALRVEYAAGVELVRDAVKTHFLHIEAEVLIVIVAGLVANLRLCVEAREDVPVERLAALN